MTFTLDLSSKESILALSKTPSEELVLYKTPSPVKPFQLSEELSKNSINRFIMQWRKIGQSNPSQDL